MVEQLFRKKLRKIVDPYKKERIERMGNLIFKAKTELGIPENIARRVVFEQEKENRKHLVESVTKNWR